ncbi:MAG: hypothetical protein O3B01_20915 [Planctomycetota bacterium]|nr:hypothetical protein [Planctomycetota bacterium]
MKEFLRNIGAFCSIALFVILVSGLVLPPTAFTFRVWEAVSVKKKDLFNGSFYPNQMVEMVEEGDLAHHTEYAVKKKVIWKTDILGFRNDRFISHPDIILVGDSNLAGSGMTQEAILVSRLSGMLEGTSVYSVAPAGFSHLTRLHQDGLLGTPRLVIQGRAEFYIGRSAPPRPAEQDPPSELGEPGPATSVSLDPFSQFLAVQRDKLSKLLCFRYLKARAKSSHGWGIQSEVDRRMFFVKGKESVIAPEPELIERCADSIESSQRYCRSIGSEFIFFPIPNKETVYFELAGLKEQPPFLSRLVERLKERGIHCVDTIRLFNELKRREVWLYHFDDTHWNGNATEAVAKELIGTMERIGFK